MMAIDRDAIIKQLLPANVTEEMDAICFKWVVNCAYSSKVATYDPAGAKKLLAEAGYPNGLDLQLNVWDPVKSIAEAVSGDLRKVGIRASVQSYSLASYVRLRGRGELTTFMGTYPIAAQPNAVNLFDLFFLADRDYSGDDSIQKSYEAAVQELDETRRHAIYEQAINRVNEMNYIYPFSSLPASFAHSKDIKIVDNVLSGNMVDVNDIVWSDYSGK
jgi:peptide/nickel transport system substrate-binding protein